MYISESIFYIIAIKVYLLSRNSPIILTTSIFGYNINIYFSGGRVGIVL